jgi:hypothetical protein
VKATDTKRCRGCRKRKELSEFYPHQHMKDGHLNKCMVCVRKRSSDRYYRIKAEVAAEARRYRVIK